MGTDGLREYLKKYRLNLPNQVAHLIHNCEPTPFSQFINNNNKERVCDEGLDLLSKMLVYDKNMRITPRDALKHPYFEPIRAL